MSVTPRIAIKVVNPPLQDSLNTILTADVVATWTTLNVSSTTGFGTISGATDYYYLVIGGYGSEGTEITLASAKTDTTFTVGALKFSHSASDPVTFIPYNQIKLYGSSVTGGTKNLIGSAIDIDCTKQFTSIEYVEGNYSYFTTTYYRSAITVGESAFSDEINIATYSFYSVKKIIEAGVKKAMSKIDENQNGSLSWNNCIDIVNEGLNEIITKKKQWNFLHKIDTSISTTTNQEYIEKPNDVSVLEYIKIDGQKINYITKLRYNQFRDAGITNGTPCNWTHKNDKIYLVPTPASVLPVTFEYFSMPETITSLTQIINQELATILIYFIASQVAYIRGNDKRGDKMYIYFMNVLNQQIEDVTGYEQAGDSEQIESTSIYGPDYDNDYLI